MPDKVLFVTGKLAASLLRDTMARAQPGFAWEIAVMKISVAALMTPEWLARFLRVPEGVDLVLLPGRMQGDPAVLQEKLGIAVEKGPKDLREIPEYFGLAAVRRGLRERMQESVLMDGPRFARRMEEALRRAWVAWCGG